METDIVKMIYHAFLDGGLVSCSFYDKMYEISYVEDRRVKTDLFIRMVAGEPEVVVSQSAPRYPVYDAKGNVIYFGI